MILNESEKHALIVAREHYDIDSYLDISTWLENINKYTSEDDYFNDKDLSLSAVKPDGINETAYIVNNPDKTGNIVSKHLYHLVEAYGKDILIGLLNSKGCSCNFSELLFQVEEKLDNGTEPATIIYLFELIINQAFPSDPRPKKHRI